MIAPQHHHGIVVIGAGIAGATIAQEIISRGHTVCVVESESGPAIGCSSHAYAIAHPHITRGSAKLLQLTRIAFALALARWGDQWIHRGALQPIKNGVDFDREAIALQLEQLGLSPEMAYAVSAEQASQLAGVARAGVWFPNAGMLSLEKTTQQLLQPCAQLTQMNKVQIDTLEREGNYWLLTDTSKKITIRANSVIVAAGLSSKKLLSSIQIKLPLKPVRGQLSFFQVNSKSDWVARLPHSIVCGDGYCIPASRLENGNMRWIVGSSFDENETDNQARYESDRFNQEQAAGLLNYAKGDQGELVPDGQFVGIRCVAGDRLPIIGALPQRPGIFVATALGSRGILWSALAAKVIADQVLAADFALLARLGFTSALAAALAPDRFLAGAVPPALGAFASNSNPILPSAPRAR
jgi:tRNA 5-methylaminomethyl-2-thiouridine biosynthesis bifunctional protein